MEKSEIHTPGEVNTTSEKYVAEQLNMDDNSGEISKLGVDIEAAKKDKALQFLSSHRVAFDPNSAEAKRVLRKIDMRILPLLFSLYLLQIMDKNSLSFAAIMGLRTDANLSSSDYSWLGSIVYFGYIVGEIPATFLMQRVPLAKYFAVMCMLWGFTVAMLAVCNNFNGLAAVRFLLGFLEVCTAPGAIYITSSWYTQKEQITRVTIWYTSSAFANMFSGFFAWAFLHASSFKWQGLFVLYGSLTFALGILLFFFLAASPTEASWLNEDEKAIALERVRGNRSGTEVWRFNKAHLKETFLDVRFYLIFILLVAEGIPTGGITAFGPTIIAGFGFSTETTTLLNIGIGASTAVGTVIALIIAKFTSRAVAGVYVLLLACVGCLMMLFIPPQYNGARYGGYVLVQQFPISAIFIITFITAGIGGSTKKFAFGCAYQFGYAVGNIIGPQTFRGDDAPNYYIAKYTMLAFIVFAACLLGTLGLIHRTWNMNRDKEDAALAQNGIVLETLENEEFSDLTDFQIKSFRYPL